MSCAWHLAVDGGPSARSISCWNGAVGQCKIITFKGKKINQEMDGWMDAPLVAFATEEGARTTHFWSHTDKRVQQIKVTFSVMYDESESPSFRSIKCLSRKFKGLSLALGLASRIIAKSIDRGLATGGRKRASASPPSPISRSTIRRPRSNKPIISIVRAPINLANQSKIDCKMPTPSAMYRLRQRSAHKAHGPIVGRQLTAIHACMGPWGA